MRTKNAKRLWPVPATLAVVAVAAFLAFGLMVDDFSTDNTLHCQAKGDTSRRSRSPGRLRLATQSYDEAGKVEVLIQDDSGPDTGLHHWTGRVRRQPL